jgi:hypothetical protein
LLAIAAHAGFPFGAMTGIGAQPTLMVRAATGGIEPSLPIFCNAANAC